VQELVDHHPLDGEERAGLRAREVEPAGVVQEDDAPRRADRGAEPADRDARRRVRVRALVEDRERLVLLAPEQPEVVDDREAALVGGVRLRQPDEGDVRLALVRVDPQAGAAGLAAEPALEAGDRAVEGAVRVERVVGLVARDGVDEVDLRAGLVVRPVGRRARQRRSRRRGEDGRSERGDEEGEPTQALSVPASA
jgi:hypothetical protein